MNDDIATLMVLRHYGLPTRLLDWSSSPLVAAYFAVSGHEDKDAELWAFDQQLYAKNGKAQWETHKETTIDLSGREDKFDAKLTAFNDDPPEWFICPHYPAGFPRQNAQKACYSMTSQFARDHANSIAELLNDSSAHHRYEISKEAKATIREYLAVNFGISRRSLYPDSAGAASVVAGELFGAYTVPPCS